jgi:putative transposase
MAWELQKVEDQRKLLIDAYFQGEFSMVELCNRFKISRKTAYKWLARYKEIGIEGLKDRPTAPIEPFTIYNEADIQLALDLKIEHWNWGPKKILAVLHRKYPKKNWPARTRAS